MGGWQKTNMRQQKESKAKKATPPTEVELQRTVLKLAKKNRKKANILAKRKEERLGPMKKKRHRERPNKPKTTSRQRKAGKSQFNRDQKAKRLAVQTTKSKRAKHKG